MSSTQEKLDAIKFWAAVLAMAALCVLAGRAITGHSPLVVLVGVAGAGVALATFVNPKFGLTIVVVSMIFSPRVQGGAAIFKANDILLLVIFFAWLARTALFKGTAFFVKTPLNGPILAYSLVCVFSSIFALLRGGLPLWQRPFFYTLKYVEYYLLFFMTVNIVDSREDVQRYLRYGFITGLAVTAFGYSQIPRGQRVTAPFDNVIGATDAGAASDSEPNTFGGYYLVVFGVLLGFFTQSEGNIYLPMLGSLLYMLPPFLLTESRSSYLGFASAALFHILATPRRRLTLIFGVGMVIIFVAAVPKLRNTVVNRVEFTFGKYGSVTGSVNIGDEKVKLEGSTYSRVAGWKRIFTERFPEHPVLGWGVTGVGICDAYYPRVAGETGALGLLCFLWIMSRIWSCGWGLLKISNRREDKALALGTLTALVGLMTHAAGANTFIIVRIMEPFWFLVALMTRVYIDESSSRKEAA